MLIASAAPCSECVARTRNSEKWTLLVFVINECFSLKCGRKETRLDDIKL